MSKTLCNHSAGKDEQLSSKWDIYITALLTRIRDCKSQRHWDSVLQTQEGRCTLELTAFVTTPTRHREARLDQIEPQHGGGD